MGRPGRWGLLKLIVFAALVVGLVATATLAPRDLLGEAILARIDAAGPWTPVLFGLLYAIATVAMLPGAPLTLAAGAIFGPVVGALAATTGATLGAAGAFLITRYLARDAVAAWASRNPRWRAIDRAIGAGGWKVVALLRLSPAVPFNLQNYVYGLTPIPFWPCVLTSWFAMLPGAFLYATIGAAGREAASGTATPLRWFTLGLGIVATLAATVYLGRIATQAMREDPEPAPSPPS